MSEVKHPAKYSKELLPIFDRLLPNDNSLILDPFAGTGKLREIRPQCVLLEIEPEWALISNAIVGDATDMPFGNCIFDAICTSPTYGNRMADSFIDHQKEKNYIRNTYTHALGRKLSKNNSGSMQWGDEYRAFHKKAYCEFYRVLKVGGIVILNISDHIRKGEIIPVTNWHIEEMESAGFDTMEEIKVPTKRNRMGKNGNLRVGFESVILLKKN